MALDSTPGVPPQVPPPPPPPYYYPTPPAGGPYPGWSPGYAPIPSIPPSPSVAIRSVRRGVELFQWVAAIGIVGQAIGLGLLATDPSLGRLSTLSSAGGFTFSVGGAGFTGVALGLVVLSAILGLTGFVLGIVAFVRWREGVQELRRTLLPSLPHEPRAMSEPGAAAISGYRNALWTILLYVLAVIGGSVAIAVMLVGEIHPTFNPNGTISPPPPSQISSAVSNLWVAAIILAIALVAIELVLAYFVTQSLEGFLKTGRAPVTSVDLGSTRLLVMLSVALGAAGVLNLFFLWLGSIAILAPILLLYACQRYVKAFDQRLAAISA